MASFRAKIARALILGLAWGWVSLPSARAGTVAGTSAKKEAPRPSAECDQSTCYSRARQRLVEQKEYLKAKLMDVATKVNSRDGVPIDELREQIPAFCPSSETDAKKCFQRYTLALENYLRKIDYANTMNSDAAYELESRAGVPAVPNTDTREREKNILGITKLKDIEARIAEMEKDKRILEMIGSPAHERFLRDLGSAPSPEEFVKTRKVVGRDGEETEEVEVDGRGKPVVDQKKYKAALKRWQDKQTEYGIDLPGDFDAIAKEYSNGKSTADFGSKLEKSRKTGIRAYGKARHMIVEAGNEKLLQAGARKNQSFAGPRSTPVPAAQEPNAPTDSAGGYESVGRTPRVPAALARRLRRPDGPLAPGLRAAARESEPGSQAEDPSNQASAAEIGDKTAAPVTLPGERSWTEPLSEEEKQRGNADVRMPAGGVTDDDFNLYYDSDASREAIEDEIDRQTE